MKWVDVVAYIVAHPQIYDEYTFSQTVFVSNHTWCRVPKISAIFCAIPLNKLQQRQIIDQWGNTKWITLFTQYI